MRLCILSLLTCFLASGLSAQDSQPGIAGGAIPTAADSLSAQKSEAPQSQPSAVPGDALPDDPTVFIGKTLAEVVTQRGIPNSMAAIRGPEAWQDDVEFSWGDGSRFDWYDNKVWRIEFTDGYKGSVFGIFIGDSEDKIVSLLGKPHFIAEDGLVWRLPWRGFPVQIRIALRDSRVTDIAVYRADL